VTPPFAHHVPVLSDRVFALLAPAFTSPGCVLVDATVGLGGHADHALRTFPSIRLVGIDRDQSALDAARDRLAKWHGRITLVHAVYDEIPQVLRTLGIECADGILFDLGVSSMQLDDPERGFSYSIDAPLDMRMNPQDPLTAAVIVNEYAEEDIRRVLRDFGEERFASRIARGIVRARESTPILQSSQLVDIVRDCIPAPARRTGGNPAKRTFQALRIEVNGELITLRRAIPAALEVLGIGGRMVVLSYQSLEDRIVKQVFSSSTSSGVPEDLPFVPEGSAPSYRLLTRGAEKASAIEVSDNPRAASVRLRAIERVAA
jgi:16S rRNA (cytosine1402-N4)-methyltransferase